MLEKQQDLDRSFDAFMDEVLARCRPGPLPRELLIYGAGNMGRRVAATLARNGHRVLGLLDRCATGSPIEEWPASSLAQWVAREAARPAVVIAVHNPANGVDAISTDLQANGFGSPLLMSDVCDAYPGEFGDCFWLAPSNYYRGQREPLRALNSLLGDGYSREVLRSTLSFRLGNAAAQPIPQARQYFANDLPRWADPVRLVDCGAYDGDTLKALADAGYRLEAAACFEPDTANFALLAGAVRNAGLPATCIPCAVSNTNEMLRFCAQASSASRQSEDGDTLVQAVRIDDAVPSFVPTLIKMDIEGGEVLALQGARRTIEKTRPGLAISVYHHANHLWQIPLMLAQWLPDHKFFLRAHAFNTFELVMYAFPPCQFTAE